MYEASNIAAFYTDKREYVGYMKKDVNVLRERGLANDGHYQSLYGAYISARMFADARDLLRQHVLKSAEKIPKLSVLPRVEGEPRAFLIDKKGHSLRLQSVEVRNGTKIVIISHPLCHFSQNAMRYIESDDSLKRLFNRHALWLVPASRKVEFELLTAWSLNHPDGSTMLAYSREDWPMIKSWDTPTFYFLKDGVVVDVVAGWPSQGNAAALRTALRKVGLDQ